MNQDDVCFENVSFYKTISIKCGSFKSWICVHFGSTGRRLISQRFSRGGKSGSGCCWFTEGEIDVKFDLWSLSWIVANVNICSPKLSAALSHCITWLVFSDMDNKWDGQGLFVVRLMMTFCFLGFVVYFWDHLSWCCLVSFNSCFTRVTCHIKKCTS